MTNLDDKRTITAPEERLEKKKFSIVTLERNF